MPVFAWQHLLLITGVYVVIFGGMYLYLQDMIPYLLLVVTGALARAASFTPLHDATHDSLSSNPRINDFLGTLSAQMLFPGINAQFYRFLHLEHHRHTGDKDKDPDELTGSSNFFKRWRTILFFDWHLVYWFLTHQQMVPRKDRVRNYITIAIYAAFHIGFLLSPYVSEFVLLWLIPTRIGLPFVTYLFASIQHPEGVLQSERPLQATRMQSDNVFWRHFTLGQSEHLMHHMFPRVPFYNYHKAWKLSKDIFSVRELVWCAPLPFFSKAGRTLPSADLNNSLPVISAVIEEVMPVSSEVKSYTLRSNNGESLPKYNPGAHIDVHITKGLVRQYSLTGLSEPGTYNIAVKCEPDGKGGSKALHEIFKTGRQIKISYPRNLFELNNDTGTVHLVAGGIGITPLLSMAETLHKQHRHFVFHVCARSIEFLPFSAYLKACGYADKVKIYLDSDKRFIQGSDLGVWSQGDALYMCGPKRFMQHVSELAKEQSWPEDSIHFEHFSSEPNENRKNKPFSVLLARSGNQFNVRAEESLLDALQRNGVTIAASCMNGLCATCECKVIEGEVDHRDMVLTENQKALGVMTACVSRAKGDRIVLDA